MSSPNAVLRARRRLAAFARVPAPADQVVVRHVLDDLGRGLAAVARRVLDLLADLAERLALPRPSRSARDASAGLPGMLLIVVGLADDRHVVRRRGRCCRSCPAAPMSAVAARRPAAGAACMSMPCSGRSPAGWQFTQRGCWITLPASSKSATERGALVGDAVELRRRLERRRRLLGLRADARRQAAAASGDARGEPATLRDFMSGASRGRQRGGTGGCAPAAPVSAPPGIGDGRADRRHAGLADAGRLFGRAR